jgi:hypothetical protein
MDKKVCSRCGIEKSLTDFNKNKKNKNNDGLQYTCGECDRKYLKKYYSENKDKNHSDMKKWREQNKNYLKKYESELRPNKERRSTDSKYRQREWRKTVKGKAHNRRHNHKRRKLGKNELCQNILDESEHPIAHHVNDNDFVWIPDDLHRLFTYSPDVSIHRNNLLMIVYQLYPELKKKRFGSLAERSVPL